MESILWFWDARKEDVGRVGGKNASLGEMIRYLVPKGIAVPIGFAITSEAYWRFIDANGLRPVLQSHLQDLANGRAALSEVGSEIRSAILKGAWPEDLHNQILAAYRRLTSEAGASAVAIRSSATAEDLPGASFAGQQESFLNISGDDAVLEAARRCYASLFTDRAISYRIAKGFDHLKVALSVGVQQMVRSDLGCAGVMFSIDTETGFDKVIVINAAPGLGELVVKGTIDPDEYRVFKPLLFEDNCIPIIKKRRGSKASKLVLGHDAVTPTKAVATTSRERQSFALADDEILQLSRRAVLVEQHYGFAMDIEWARDGEGALFIVQARPETIQSGIPRNVIERFSLTEKGKCLATGIAIGQTAATGTVCIIQDPSQIADFRDGSVLVAATTDPDWVPIMKRAAAIVTDHGGRTSHAAIVSRELGVPAVVGAGNATAALKSSGQVTVSCAEGEQGYVYEGVARIEAETIDLATVPTTRTAVMLNLADPASALRWWRLPADGIGLARMEFLISSVIRAHPMALVHYDELRDKTARQTIASLTEGYADKCSYFVETLSLGLAQLAALVHPKPMIVRLSDFKSNEYAGLVGGAEFESPEENPMIGFRGASRYYSPKYRNAFSLECQALRMLRDRIGFKNIIVMVPFCRTVAEAKKVIGIMAEEGLQRGANGLQVFMMCEIPSNVILATEFARYFDGFSIGSNDLTQLTLGVDRDASDLADIFDEQDPAVMWLIKEVIARSRSAQVKIGLCGEAPSNRPTFAAFLVECGIDSISVTPGSFWAVKNAVADAEKNYRAKVV